GVMAEVRAGGAAEVLAAVRVRVRAHAARPPRGKLGQLRHEAAVLAEELLGAVAAQPLFEDPEVVGVLADIGDRHLVRAPSAFDRKAVDLLRAGPALRRSEDDHRPLRPSLVAVLPRSPLDLGDLIERLVERARERLVDRSG